VFSFYFRDQAIPYYGASDPQYNAAQPNNFMYYDLMRWGGQNGYTVFDFGRSKRVRDRTTSNHIGAWWNVNCPMKCTW